MSLTTERFIAVARVGDVPEGGVNGPPTTPLAEKPVCGATTRLVCGVMIPVPEPASAAIKFAVGEPQPVQRS